MFRHRSRKDSIADGGRRSQISFCCQPARTIIREHPPRAVIPQSRRRIPSPLAGSQEQQATFTPECTIKNTGIFTSSPRPQPRYRCCFIRPPQYRRAAIPSSMSLRNVLTRFASCLRQITRVKLSSSRAKLFFLFFLSFLLEKLNLKFLKWYLL